MTETPTATSMRAEDARALLVLHENQQTGRRLHQELADDFPVFVAEELESARRMLENRSIRVLVVSRGIVASSGPEFLELLSSEFPRITPIVMDVDDATERADVQEKQMPHAIADVAANVRRAFSMLQDTAVAPDDGAADRAAQLPTIDTVQSRTDGDATLRSEVFGTAAHDLRNPLSVILSLTELMLQESTLGPEETQQFLEAIRSNADEMHRLLDDVQEIARIETGRIEATRTDVDVAQLLADAVADAQPSKPVSVERATGVSTWPLDATQMRKALCLLVADSVARAETRVVIRASIDSGELRIGLCDDGSARDPAAMKELADSLRRGRRRGGDVSVGTGLGPALAARIIESHDGVVTVTTGDHETVLDVRLPDTR